MTKQTAHEIHKVAADKAAAQKHEPGQAAGDGGAAAAAADIPKGLPHADRHATETAAAKAPASC